MDNRVLSTLVLIILVSCGRPPGEVHLANVDNSGWGRSEPSYVYYNNKDTVSLRTITLVIRQTDLFRYSHLVFTVETLAPDYRLYADTLSVEAKNLLDPKQVAGAVTYEDIEVMYKTKAMFPVKGKYRFRFEHMMPDSLLTGITGIGIKID